MMPRSTSTRFFRAPGSVLAMLVLLRGAVHTPPSRHGRARSVRMVAAGADVRAAGRRGAAAPPAEARPLNLIDCRLMTEPRLPLQGIRVLELAQVVAGPFCGALMAEFGAEVIKTEMPGRGDDLRRLGPTEDGCTYWFAVDNRNKKLMTLDLHSPKGQEIVRRLVPQCDVVL